MHCALPIPVARGALSYPLTRSSPLINPEILSKQPGPPLSLRFWALPMRDVGAIKSSPQHIIEQGIDLRFLNELKKELKA